MGIVTGPGGPQAFSSASGGKCYPINGLNTIPVPVAPANTGRTKITFHNPGTVDVYVAPNVTATGAPMVVGPGTLGGCLLVFANGGTVVVDGECQTGWGGFVASIANGLGVLTVMDTNI